MLVLDGLCVWTSISTVNDSVIHNFFFIRFPQPINNTQTNIIKCVKLPFCAIAGVSLINTANNATS